MKRLGDGAPRRGSHRGSIVVMAPPSAARESTSRKGEPHRRPPCNFNPASSIRRGRWQTVKTITLRGSSAAPAGQVATECEPFARDALQPANCVEYTRAEHRSHCDMHAVDRRRCNARVRPFALLTGRQLDE